MEVQARVAALLDVEAGQARRDGGDIDESERPAPVAVLQQQLVTQHRRGDAEAHEIDERIELGAERRAGACVAGDAAVDAVRDRGEHDEPSGKTVVAPQRGDDRPKTEEQISERQRVRQDDNCAPPPRFCRPGPYDHGVSAVSDGRRARMVTPPTARLPTRTSTLAVAGR